jgi:hypothetical protein
MRPNFYVTSEQLNHAVGPGFWSIQDLPPARAEAIRPFLNNGDTLAVFASGAMPLLATSEGAEIGGIDWIRLEPNPRDGEPALNAYHFVILQHDRKGYPVIGPIKDGAIISHWSEPASIDMYL